MSSRKKALAKAVLWWSLQDRLGELLSEDLFRLSPLFFKQAIEAAKLAGASQIMQKENKVEVIPEITKRTDKN